MSQALMQTDFTARVVWLGNVDPARDDIRSDPLTRVGLTYEGLPGGRHSGLVKPSCVRTADQHSEGTPIRNVRQLSVLSAEELAEIAAEAGLDAIDPAWMGASLVIEGIEDWTHVPPSSRLQSGAGTTICIDMENRPCVYPGKEIEKDHPGRGKAFLPAARGRRGVTAWVEREGPLAVGDELRLSIPDQRTWRHLETALSPGARQA